MQSPALPNLDLTRLNTYSLFSRPSKVHARQLGCIVGAEATVNQLLNNLPDQLAGCSLRRWRDALWSAHQDHRPVVAALGGHVVKTGCTPYLIDWIRRGVLSAVCLNGAAAIHDVELAVAGHTSEDVAAGLIDGSFGMARETSILFARAANEAHDKECGLGAALGAVLQREPCARPDISLVRTAAEASIPCSIHITLGTDVVHMHPCISGAHLGEASLRDFYLICAVVAGLAKGVWMNLGSAVILPEVFLKAVSVARNLGHTLEGMTTVDLDMVQQYRAQANVLERPNGNAISITGHHEIMIPLIHAAVAARLHVPEANRPGNNPE